MPRPFRWEVWWGQSVLKEIDQAPPDVREDFTIFLYELAADPTSPKLGVLRSRDDNLPPVPNRPGYAGSYTVQFKKLAILEFEILADHPWIHLIHLVWLRKP